MRTLVTTYLQEIEAIKARVKEMEEEAEKLKEMQGEVEKQMMSTKAGENNGLCLIIKPEFYKQHDLLCPLCRPSVSHSRGEGRDGC